MWSCFHFTTITKHSDLHLTDSKSPGYDVYQGVMLSIICKVPPISCMIEAKVCHQHRHLQRQRRRRRRVGVLNTFLHRRRR